MHEHEGRKTDKGIMKQRKERWIMTRRRRGRHQRGKSQVKGRWTDDTGEPGRQVERLDRQMEKLDRQVERVERHVEK